MNRFLAAVERRILSEREERAQRYSLSDYKAETTLAADIQKAPSHTRLKIIEMLRAGHKQVAIARELGVSQSLVSDINLKEVKHVPKCS